jgi:hypothetical protein
MPSQARRCLPCVPVTHSAAHTRSDAPPPHCAGGWREAAQVHARGHDRWRHGHHAHAAGATAFGAQALSAQRGPLPADARLWPWEQIITAVLKDKGDTTQARRGSKRGVCWPPRISDALHCLQLSLIFANQTEDDILCRKVRAPAPLAVCTSPHSTLCLLRRSLTPSQPATQTLRRVRDACCRIAACAARPRRVLRRSAAMTAVILHAGPAARCVVARHRLHLRRHGASRRHASGHYALTPLLGGDRLRRSCRRPASSRRHGSCHALGVARNAPG